MSFAMWTFATPIYRTFASPTNRTFARRTIATSIFFLFMAHFSWLFDLQLMEDNKDGKEEVLDEVVMEHIK